MNFEVSIALMSPLGHFQTKSDAYRSASIGLVLLQELTFWRSATKVGAGISCTFHAALIVVQFGSSDLEALRRGRRTTAGQAQRHCRQAHCRGEDPRRPENREGRGGGERRTAEADLGPVRYLATLLGQADEVVLRWFILVVALLLDPAAMLLLLAATRIRF
jgi:hypothetical protein